MLVKHLDLTFSMVWTLVIANILVAAMLMVWSKQVAKVAFVRGHLIVPGVILFVFMGAWLGTATIGDWITCLIMGTIGFIMKRSGWPRPPLVLALILGSILENAFLISMRVHDGVGWLSRPIVLIILVFVILTIGYAVRGHFQMKKADEVPTVGEGAEKNPVLSAPFSFALAILFIAAAVNAFVWPIAVRRLPLTIAIPGAVFALWAFCVDWRDLVTAKLEAGGLVPAIKRAADSAILSKAGAFLGYLLALVVAAYLAGQFIALPLFIAIYLWRWGGYGWRVALGYAAAGWAVLFGFYDQVMHIMWHVPLLVR